MLTDQNEPAETAQAWTLHWLERSPMHMPLARIARHLPAEQWPDIDTLNKVLGKCDRQVSNARGKAIKFVKQAGKPACFDEQFEPRTFLRAQVMVRSQSWHDLFNALVWMTFPNTKAAINARHFALLQTCQGGQRTPAGDALTHFDEDGLVVVSSSQYLLELLLNFRWKELFWQHRQAVRAQMRFVLFGHAMYEKALKPFVGMTAKSVLLRVPPDVLCLESAAFTEQVDRRLAAYVTDPRNLTRGRALAPLPVLGVPGWWAQNEISEFYDDVRHFRSGRLRGA
jgi:hypothetical protein